MSKHNDLQITYLPVHELVPYANNARTHSAEQVQQLVASIEAFGFTNPVLIDEAGGIIAGHGRCMAAHQLGMAQVPTITLRGLTADQKRAYVIADNKLALNAGWDEALLAQEMAALYAAGYDTALTGFSDGDIEAMLAGLDGTGGGSENTGVKGNLAAMFGVAPFSVINARDGEWLARKKAWAAQIGDTGESRENTLAAPGSIMEDIGSVSILDGALAEVMCKWFAKPGWHALDPFAGDSVFGFVACSTGLKFTGIELRQEQATLNQQRLDAAGLAGTYICDTSENMDAHVKNATMDFVFSCPPYADLEVYSDDPRDLSNMAHADFFKLYSTILGNTYHKLKPNRFACIVTSEVRGKKGEYIGLVPQTIAAMQAAGYHYYNEIILVTPCGTLPQRAGKSMHASRKVGRTHQNVLIFYKGDLARIGKTLGKVGMDFGEDEADGLQG